MKRLVCLFLICVTALLCVSPAFAATTDSTCNNAFTSTTIINEYDFLLSISEETNEELSAQGYTATDIAKIRNVREAYDNHLLQFKDMDEEVLKHLGYSDEQVEIFRNYTGTEEQIRSLAATLELTLSADYVTWSAKDNRTNARLRYDYDWSGVPSVRNTDIVAVSWNDWTIDAKMSYVTYTHIYGSEADYSLAATYVSNNGPNSNGGGFKFKMKQEDYYWAKSGYGLFTLYHNYVRHDLSAYAEYGHTTFSASPSFSIPGYGSISFSFGTYMEGQAWEDMKCAK